MLSRWSPTPPTRGIEYSHKVGRIRMEMMLLQYCRQSLANSSGLTSTLGRCLCRLLSRPHLTRRYFDRKFVLEQLVLPFGWTWTNKAKVSSLLSSGTVAAECLANACRIMACLLDDGTTAASLVKVKSRAPVTDVVLNFLCGSLERISAAVNAPSGT